MWSGWHSTTLKLNSNILQVESKLHLKRWLGVLVFLNFVEFEN